MKNTLFWIIAVCLGIIIVYLALKDKANWVMATFTIVLAVATIWNIRITQGLLKYSEEASRQTRQAFEIDIFNKIVSSSSQLNAELRTAGFSKNARPPYIQNFAAGMLIALKDIDPIAFEKVGKAIEVWNKKYKIKGYAYPAETFLVALNKVREK